MNRGMTREEVKSCIYTIEMLQRLAYNIHGVMDVIDADNCKKIIKALEQEPTPKNDLGVDCISRAQAQTEIEMNASRYTIAKERGGMGQVEWSDQLIKVSDAVDIIRHLPSVTPQEPRKGHWFIDERPESDGEVICSNCEQPIFKYHKLDFDYRPKFCPNCGADMRGEDKE